MVAGSKYIPKRLPYYGSYGEDDVAGLLGYNGGDDEGEETITLHRLLEQNNPRFSYVIDKSAQETLGLDDPTWEWMKHEGLSITLTSRQQDEIIKRTKAWLSNPDNYGELYGDERWAEWWGEFVTSFLP